MRCNLQAVLFASISMIIGFSAIPLTAQVSLEDQLKAQYQLVKMGEDSSGAAVVEKGTLLDVKKGGILSVPYSDQSSGIVTKYQDGAVHSPNAIGMKARSSFMSKFGKTQTTSFFQSGSKVYPTKVQVNLDKDQVLIGIVSCDSCNNTQGFNKADVAFVFSKGTLAKMNASQVEDAIAGLLAIDDGSGDQGNNQQGDQNQGDGNQQGGGGGQGQQQQAPADPVQISIGMTPDQVKSANGNPDKIVNLGAKQIYVYKDMKITFMNGKVSDVQ